MERAMLGKEREEMVKMCKELLTYGIHHVVFENLTKSFARTRAKNAEFCGINYNRLMSFLHFSSLKDEFMHIALHYDICVSLVHPHYSSKQCSECGCIDDENRRCQKNILLHKGCVTYIECRRKCSSKHIQESKGSSASQCFTSTVYKNT